MGYVVSCALAVCMGLFMPPSLAKSGSGSKSSTTSERYHSGYTQYGRPRADGVPRDANGRIARSSTAKTEFKRSNPCPATGRSSGSCPGYVIDHVRPLKRGGADSPSNMQWQTASEAKAKDKFE